MRRPGKPVIIEGQSGSGKTCAARKILEQIEAHMNYVYLSARNAHDFETIIRIATEGTPGTFVIDDFHRLSPETQEKLANLAKLAAEQGEHTVLPKLILIGINHVGASLIQMVPDIAKRCGVHRILPGNKETIKSMVDCGCELLNLEPIDVEAIYAESKGDYWLSQQLCQALCTRNGILETVDKRTAVQVDIAALRPAVVDKLHVAYYACLKEFCRGKRFRPSNDPYYRLLQAISQQDSSIVDLNALADSSEEARGSINNIKDRRLSVLLDTKPLCRQHFFYNGDTKYFAIEDPALFYFLKHLDWGKLRTECGFKKNIPNSEYDFALSFQVRTGNWRDVWPSNSHC